MTLKEFASLALADYLKNQDFWSEDREAEYEKWKAERVTDVRTKEERK